jgi:hypothetical protein
MAKKNSKFSKRPLLNSPAFFVVARWQKFTTKNNPGGDHSREKGVGMANS